MFTCQNQATWMKAESISKGEISLKMEVRKMLESQIIINENEKLPSNHAPEFETIKKYTYA